MQMITNLKQEKRRGREMEREGDWEEENQKRDNGKKKIERGRRKKMEGEIGGEKENMRKK